MGVVYDTIGTGYAGPRQEDPRIAARIAAALGDADRMLNVGAGTCLTSPSSTSATAS